MRRAGSAWNSRAGCSPCMGTGLESKRWPLTALPCGGGSYAQNFPAVREGCSILQLWAGVAFSARNGDTEGLLSEAARTGLHLTDIFPAPGGFTARCAAWRYLRLAKLARKRRVHLRIRKKTGLFFLLRPYLRRRGLWAGLLLFVPLLLWSQGLVWAVDASGLTTGQQARAASVLRETVSLMPGSIVTQEKLAAGEYALLQSGEFSWVSLNFLDGRLELEAAEAKPVPEIAAGTLHGLRAKAAGTVVSTNLVSGTMLVVPGQAVEKGQGLIGTARAERDGTLIFQPAAGSVRAQFEWEFAEELPLTAATYQLTGNTVVQQRLFLAGRVFPLPSLFSPADDSAAVTRHLQPELLGLTLPLSVEETTYYEQAENEIHSSEDEARALTRLHGLQALQNDYPDAEFVAQKVDVTTENDTLHYRVVYTIIADICT